MKYLSVWQKFWFEPTELLGVALTRTVFGITLFFTYLCRFGNINLLSTEAFLPKDQAILIFPEQMRPIFSWTFWPDTWVLPMSILFCILILIWTFGFGGRLVGVFVWIIHMGFIQRNYAIVFGADVMSAVFMFYLSMIETPSAIKNGGLLRSPKALINESLKSDFISSAMIRLLQIHLAVIYAYTGFEKLKGVTWWDGTALWSVFANPQMVWIDLTFIKSISWVIPLLAFFTIIFEIYFPAAMLSKKIKYYWLGIGVLFHIVIAFLMQLWSFSLVMISIYFLYVDDFDLKKILKRIY